jgi:hypothetical protein
MLKLIYLYWYTPNKYCYNVAYVCFVASLIHAN